MSKFKVGDEVRLSSYGTEHIGQVVDIADVATGNSYPYIVELYGTDRFEAFSEDELEAR